MLSEIELEFSQLKHRWKLFCELYDKNEDVELLNKSGAHIFGLFQKLVIDDAMLALCRITDPPKSCGKNNNSLNYHFEERKYEMDSSLKNEILTLFESLNESMKNIRHMRNLGISHSDYDIAVKRKSLPNITYSEIEESIELVGEILNKLFNTTGQYLPTTSGTAGKYLLKILSEWHKIEKAKSGRTDV